MRLLPAALAAALLAVPGVAAAETPETAGRIAFVNVRKLFDQSQRLKDFEESMKKEKADREGELKKLAAQIDENLNMLQGLDKKSKVRRGIEETLTQLKAKYDFLVKAWNDESADRVRNAEREYYNEALEVVAAVAKEKGFAAVLKVELEPLTPEESEKIERRIDARSALYVDPALDITEEVIRRLNEKHAKAKAAGGNGETPK